MKNLLKIIKKNNKVLDVGINVIIAYAVSQSGELEMQKNYVKSQAKKSRISGIEALIEILKSKKQKPTGKIIVNGKELKLKLHSNVQVGYNQSIDDIIKILQETIKKLK